MAELGNQMGSQPKFQRVELLPVQRRAQKLVHLKIKHAASIAELAEEPGVTMSIVRWDLECLEDAGYLERTHGGAMLQPTESVTFEPETSIAAEDRCGSRTSNRPRCCRGIERRSEHHI